MKKEAIAFQWNDSDKTAQYGDGISHPVRGAKTKSYKLIVKGAQISPMKVELKAETQKHALRYGKARWPGAVIELVG